MATKKSKKQLPSQPSQPEQPKQTLLSIKPIKVEEPKAEPPTDEAQVLADVEVKPPEQLKPPEQVEPPEQLKPLEQVEPPEQLKPPEQVEPLELLKPPEQVEPPEQLKPPEQVEPLEQLKEKPIAVKPKPIKRLVTLPTPVEANLQALTPAEANLQALTPAEANLESSNESKSDAEVDASAQTQTNNAIFQAVGIITGVVNFNPEGKAIVSIQGKEYPLYYSPNHRKAFDALRLQAKKNPDKVERLIVYPRVMHFPKREQHYQMSFQLLGFESPHTTEGISKELENFEFRLCGLWQFIPVCQTPCISVFKNFTGERLEYIKQAEPDRKVRFMKASHIPLIWRDAPVRPFRFNPKLDKEQQGQSLFVEVLARFLPASDVFGFIRMIGQPGKAPKFLKAGKKDKAEALKTKLAIANKSITKKKSWSKPKKKDS